MDTIELVRNKLKEVSLNNVRIMSATKLGKFDNRQIMPVHFPRTAELASLLVYYDNFGHHTAAVIAGKVNAGILGTKADSHTVDQLRSSIRNNVTHAAKALFEFAYPNQRGEWESRPWLFTGVNSEPAMLECGVILLRELAGLVYINSGSPLSEMLLPNIELVAETMKLIFNMEVLSAGPSEYRGMSLDTWKNKVVGNIPPLKGTDANRRLPMTVVKPSLAMSSILSAVAKPTARTGAEAALYGDASGIPDDISPMSLVSENGKLYITRRTQSKGSLFDVSTCFQL